MILKTFQQFSAKTPAFDVVQGPVFQPSGGAGQFTDLLAVDSDGSTTYAVSPGTEFPWEGKAIYTLVIRMKPDALTSSTYLIRQDGILDVTFRPGTFDWVLHVGGSIKRLLLPKPTVDVWTTYVFVYDGAQMAAYKDGNITPVDTLAVTGSIGSTVKTTKFFASAEPGGVFDGRADDYWFIEEAINITNDIPRIGAIVPPNPGADPLNVAAYLMGDGVDDTITQLVPVGGDLAASYPTMALFGVSAFSTDVPP